MNPYAVEFMPQADKDLIGLPNRAFTALFAVLGEVRHTPWSATFPDDRDHAELRWVPFDQGDGAASLRIDEAARTVWVYAVTWIG